MSLFGTMNLLRRAATAVAASALVAGILLAGPAPASAVVVESSADLMTSVAYTTPTSQFELWNEADTAKTTFVQGDGNDDAATSSPYFNDIYTIHLFHSAISLIPTVSSKATWSCSVSSDGSASDDDCSAYDLIGGESAQIVVTVEAENGDINEYTFNIDAYATDATLTALAVDTTATQALVLSPAFNAAVTSYTATTGKPDVDIDPTAATGATFECKKGSYVLTACDFSGVGSDILAVGSNTISILVTAEDGKTKKTYTVTITRVVDTNNEILSIDLSWGGLLTAASTNSSSVRTQFSPTVMAYDLTSNDDNVDMTVYLKNEDGTFDCEDVGLSESSNDLDNASGATCAFDLTGAGADSGYTIKITVDPEGAAGTNKEYVFTVRLSTVAAAGPIPTLLPTSLVVGDSVSFNGTVGNLFTGESSVQYQWYLCTLAVTPGSYTSGYIPRNKGCVAKSGAIQSTYTVVASDAGKHLLGALIGQPGNVLEYSASKPVAGAPGLANSAKPPAPTETGLVGAEIGQAVDLENIDLADFTGVTDIATQVQFQWYRCTGAATTATTGASLTTPSGCTKISGAQDDSYVPDTSLLAATNDAGKYLRARLILSVGRTDYMVYTRTTNLVFGPPTSASAPGKPSAPSSLTILKDTADVTASNGTWTANPALDTTVAENFTYQWYTCRQAIANAPEVDPTTLFTKRGAQNCEEIPGAVSKVLTVTLEWCGKYLLVGVVADNTDFRNKGGSSDMRWSPTSASAIWGTACL